MDHSTQEKSVSYHREIAALGHSTGGKSQGRFYGSLGLVGCLQDQEKEVSAFFLTGVVMVVVVSGDWE